MVASGSLIDRGTPGTPRKPHICACGRTGRNLEIEQKANSLKPGSAIPSRFLSSTEDYTRAAGSGNRFFAGDGAFAASCPGFIRGLPSAGTQGIILFFPCARLRTFRTISLVDLRNKRLPM